MARVAIGVDIGGTNVRVGLVDERGKLLQKVGFLTQSAGNREAMLRKILESAKNFLAEAKRRK